MHRHAKDNFARPAGSSALVPRRTAAATRPGVYIVFVEDDPTILMQARKSFAQWYSRPKVKFVSNGFNALLELTLEVPDLLIAKIATPYFDGLSMVRCIRDFPEYAGLPLALIADNRQEQLLAKRLDCGNLTILQRRGLFDRLEPMVESLAMSKWKRSAVKH